MSRGPWKPETRAKRAAEPVRCKNAQRTPSADIQEWVDRRAEARAKAKAALDELRASVLWRVASQNRNEAKARGVKRYIGHPCDKHDTAERYTSTGHCVICAREIRDQVRGTPTVNLRLDRKLRRKSVRAPLVTTGRFSRLNFEDVA
jgi:hypothetical protein